jgi:hypothetical protein
MATVYCGVDFRARKQTISYLTIEDGEIKQSMISGFNRNNQLTKSDTLV